VDIRLALRSLNKRPACSGRAGAAFRHSSPCEADEITIARPSCGVRAPKRRRLVEIAETKGEQHLLAISARWWLKEVVTTRCWAAAIGCQRRIVGIPVRGFRSRFAIIRRKRKPTRIAVEVESGPICLRNSGTTPEQSDRRGSRALLCARRLIFSRKSETQSRPPQRGGSGNVQVRDFTAPGAS